jgi:tetratricopeptide (TPR) repeat protein
MPGAQKEDAVQIMYGIRESLNKFYIDNNEKARTYPAVLFNLAYFLNELDRYEEAKDICEEALRISIRYKNPRYIPYILAELAKCYHSIGDDHNLKEFTLRAYYTARAFEDFAQAKEIAEIAQSKFKLHLKHIEIPNMEI